MVNIHGTTDPRFAKVRNAFASNFEDGLEHGAGVAVMLDGKLVVDLWGGHADASKTREWKQDTLVNVWSCTKGVVATAVAICVERSLLRYDEPIAKVWPAFAANGKEAISLDLVVSHQAGLNGFSNPVGEDIIYDWAAYTTALAAMAPNWKPGTTCAYHALSYGHLAGEPLRRVTGKSIGQFISKEIAAPLGVEFFVGIPESEDHRTAKIIEGPKTNNWVDEVLKSKYPQSCKNPTPVASAPNHRRWRATEIPGGNGHCSAAGLACIYGDLVSGNSKLIHRDTLAEASRVRFRGLDESFNIDTVWGAGFRMEDPNAYGARASTKTVGHGGWGGSVAFGDPEAKLGFAYVTNHMLGFDDGIDVRRKNLSDAVYDALS
jgi:CubicO group peptidase (beta-lactamase class C family)